MSAASAAGSRRLYVLVLSRRSTLVIDAWASRVSNAITVFASASAAAGLSPRSWNMRDRCAAYWSRSVFDASSVFV